MLLRIAPEVRRVVLRTGFCQVLRSVVPRRGRATWLRTAQVVRPPVLRMSSRRPSAGEHGTCDVAEFCDGVSNTCPADGFLSSATQCVHREVHATWLRTARELGRLSCGCQSTAQCRVSAGPVMWRNSVTVSATLSCGRVFIQRYGVSYLGGTCDVAENCTGSSAACPADVKSTASAG